MSSSSRSGGREVSAMLESVSQRGLRSVPDRIMTGIQFFEARIDDQLLPRAAYDDLLARPGFVDIGSMQLTPMHAVTYGRRPGR